MPPSFDDWKYELLDSAGSAAPQVRRLGDYVLRLFWQDGCEATIRGLLEYAQARLADCHTRSLVVDAREDSRIAG